jgi:hypothetical protein
MAAGLFVCFGSASAGCSTQAASCPCFQHLLREAGCGSHGGTELGFPAARAFRGRFVSPRGPVAGGRVAVQAEGGGTVRIVSTDAAGRFDLGPLEAGAYRFVVCRPRAAGASGWVAVSPIAPDAPLEFELPE